jgi:hypothetical protein
MTEQTNNTTTATRFDVEINNGNNAKKHTINPEVENWWKVCVYNGRVGTHAWDTVSKRTLFDDFHRNSATLPHTFWRDMHSLGVELYSNSVPSLDQCRQSVVTDSLTTELQSAFTPSHVLATGV